MVSFSSDKDNLDCGEQDIVQDAEGESSKSALEVEGHGKVSTVASSIVPVLSVNKC